MGRIRGRLAEVRRLLVWGYAAGSVAVLLIAAETEGTFPGIPIAAVLLEPQTAVLTSVPAPAAQPEMLEVVGASSLK